MRNLLKIVVLVLIVFFSSCSIEQKKELSKVKVDTRQISLVQFKNETGMKNFRTFINTGTDINDELSRSQNLSDFIIDTLVIQKYVDVNYKSSYSFRIYPFDSKPLVSQKYNLVYRKESNVWQKAIFAFKEKITVASDKKKYEEVHTLYDSQSRGDCTIETITISCNGSCTGACDGFGCPTGECLQHTIKSVPCGNNGSTGNGGIIGTSPPAGGTPTSGAGGVGGSVPNSEPIILNPIVNPYTFDPNILDNPAFDDANYVNAIKAIQFYNSLLAPHGQVWANENSIVFNQLIQFQIDNQWSSASNAIAFNLFQTLISHITPTFEISEYPGKADGLPFEWWTNDQFIKDNLKIFDDSKPNAPAEVPNIFEIMLFKQYPVAAWIHVQNALDASSATQVLVAAAILTEPHNGRADAFRHAFWNALGTAENGSFITKLFTDAHEIGSDNHPLETQMNLFNNAQGIAIGATFSATTSNNVIQSQILNAINFGTIQYLNPIAANTGNVLTTTTIKWSNQ